MGAAGTVHSAFCKVTAVLPQCLQGIADFFGKG
jgi:hypothetical protein